MTVWSWVIGPWDEIPDWELTKAKGRTATWRLGPAANSETSMTLDERTQDAARISELITDLWIFCDGDPCYRGRFGGTDTQWTGEKPAGAFSTADYRALLARRELYDLNLRSWTDVDQASIAWQMIQQIQGNDGGDLGIVQGVGTSTGVTRTQASDAGSMAGPEIDKLAQMDDGFEWDVTPTATSALHLDIWHPQRGTDRDIVLEHGGNAQAVSRGFDPSTYANALRLSGGAPQGGGSEPVPEIREASDITSRPEGRWDASLSASDISSQTALAARADFEQDAQQVLTPSWVVELPANAWGGPGHIWLGDPVGWVCKSGRYDVDETLRVQQIDATWSGNGSVKARFTLGALGFDSRFRARKTDQRLAALERR